MYVYTCMSLIYLCTQTVFSFPGRFCEGGFQFAVHRRQNLYIEISSTDRVKRFYRNLPRSVIFLVLQVSVLYYIFPAFGKCIYNL